MNFDDMVEAVRDAQRTQAAADRQVRDIAKLLVGNLRRVGNGGFWDNHETLGALKKELTQYNASTQKWKS